MEKQVFKLPPKPRMEKRTRVAAYARVSSGKDTMLHSLAQQVSYYSDLIQKEPGWVFAGVYADEARTGTKEERPEFQRLLSDCRNGKVDMVITKSISRFARNTVTSLETVRELKALGVDVYFEEERIHTMSSDGELMLTILSSYAQEESRSVSENQKWRIRGGFEEGKLMCLRILFGYRISKNNGIVVDPEQAAIVREIYARVIRGDTLGSIARWLNSNAVYGAYGGKWKNHRVRDLVTNEKYTGNALLQKAYVNNHIEKKLVKNCGELPQYYATETHPPIIDQDTFDAAQAMLAKKRASYPKTTPKQHYAFTRMILCSSCGKHYKHIQNHGLSRWACPTFIGEGKSCCESKKIPEEILEKVVCEQLGLDAFDEDTFREVVDHITSIYPNKLVIHLKNGTERVTEWEYESRAKSWTPEMKAQASIREKGRRHG